MSALPDMIKQGESARLFPVLADTSREGRIASIFLALLPNIPAFAQCILGTAGLRVGARTRIRTFTEIVLRDASEIRNRPDGLIVVETGKTTWTALVEAKIGKAELDADQVARYLDAAKANQIDAVITMSNQFVARADVSPLVLPKNTLKKAGLFHWSWTWIRTQCDLIAHQKEVEDHEQAFLLREFQRLLQHPTTGIERFTQMVPNWKTVVQAVSMQEALKRTSPEVEETVAAWFQELRDMSLLLSSHVGQPVTEKIDRNLLVEPSARLKEGCRRLAEENRLAGSFVVPAAASEIEVCADLARRSIMFGMKLKAPQDRKSTRARVNWLLRMLKEDDPRLAIRAHWPGRRQPSQKDVSVLRADPDAIDEEKSEATPHAFDVLLVDLDAKRFAGRRTFIETLEACSQDFYDLVGQNLRAWQTPPPKPVKTGEAAPIAEDHDEAGGTP